MAISISDLVRNPYKLDGETLAALRKRVAECPYDQTARLLLLYNMYQLRDTDYSTALHKQAIYLADRNILFRATEGQALGLSTALNTQAPYTERPHERSTSLIDRFLNSPRAKEPSRSPNTTPADPTSDYMAYWTQQHADEVYKPQAPEIVVKSGQRLNSLLHEAALQPLEALTTKETTDTSLIEEPKHLVQDEHVATPNSQSSNQHIEGEEAFFTETLAKIYINQQRYERAIEILRVLSTRNPKKNRYFADQIRFLHKLAINQRFSADS
ncbi:MAG: hypothetical protein Q4A44_03155 [Bacteroidales bacterium]|nr:hypothetical protein [Bacteroidales bacterium]